MNFASKLCANKSKAKFGLFWMPERFFYVRFLYVRKIRFFFLIPHVKKASCVTFMSAFVSPLCSPAPATTKLASKETSTVYIGQIDSKMNEKSVQMDHEFKVITRFGNLLDNESTDLVSSTSDLPTPSRHVKNDPSPIGKRGSIRSIVRDLNMFVVDEKVQNCINLEKNVLLDVNLSLDTPSSRNSNRRHIGIYFNTLRINFLIGPREWKHILSVSTISESDLSVLHSLFQLKQKKGFISAESFWELVRFLHGFEDTISSDVVVYVSSPTLSAKSSEPTCSTSRSFVPNPASFFDHALTPSASNSHYFFRNALYGSSEPIRSQDIFFSRVPEVSTKQLSSESMATETSSAVSSVSPELGESTGLPISKFLPRISEVRHNSLIMASPSKSIVQRNDLFVRSSSFPCSKLTSTTRKPQDACPVPNFKSCFYHTNQLASRIFQLCIIFKNFLH